jgi:hypothetical protein
MPSAVKIQGPLGRELRQYAIVAAYLYVCFGALILYKAAILSGRVSAMRRPGWRPSRR